MSKPMVLILAFLCATAAPGVVSTVAAQNQDATNWEVPRTSDGRPDLQGNWTNATLTPFTRRGDQGPVYTLEQVAEIEQGIDGCPPNPGTVACGRRSGGGLGGQEYNEVYWDRGSRVAIVAPQGTWLNATATALSAESTELGGDLRRLGSWLQEARA